MKMKLMMIALAAMSTSAMGANFGHPDAQSVAMMGSGTVEVCHYNRDYPTPIWECYPRELLGARNPMVITLPEPGPVVIRGATWAFAAEECMAEPLDLTGIVDSPILPSKLDSKLYGSIGYGVCPGWEPLNPAQ
jgi:hypothetical protein